MSEELKPCPAESVHGIRSGAVRFFVRRSDCFGVYCEACGASTGYYGTIAEAAAAWNTRAADTELADPNVVHVNMLRGTIAKPSVAQIRHIYGDELDADLRRKLDVAREALEDADVAMTCRDDDSVCQCGNCQAGMEQSRQLIRAALATIGDDA